MALIDPQDELICLRAGEQPGSDHGRDHGPDHGAVLPPIVQASLFRRTTMEQLHQSLSREHLDPVYSRGTNPTVAILEQTLAQLERGEACKCFASGMGAISATLFGLLKAGDHILFVNDIYGPTIELAQRLADFGVSHSRSFATDIAEIAADIRDETRMIYIESPGSNLFGLLPIAEIAALAKSRNIWTVIDNSVATPLLQKPLLLGVDLVVHSCSKYIGGHSDVIGGALIGSRELVERIFYKAYMLLGAVMAPFDSWLLLRGLLTLPTRIARHHHDGLAVARYLGDHPRIAHVYHPALSPDDAPLFAKQMRGHSGLFSIAINDADFAATVAIANRLRLFGKAVSWGGPESLVMTGHKRDPGNGHGLRNPTSLLRLSIGFEGVENLIDDLAAALS